MSTRKRDQELATFQELHCGRKARSYRKIEGIAWDTGRTEDKQECLILKIDAKIHKVLLQDVKALTALVKNPHFTTVTFLN